MTQINTVAGIQISYSQDQEELLQRHLATLLLAIRGASSLMIGFHVSPPLHVLAALISIQDIHDEYLARDLIFAASVKLQTELTPSVPGFAEALGIEAKRYLSRPIKDYHILLPLNATFGSQAEAISLTVLGVKLLCNTWNHVHDSYAVDKLIEDAGGYLGEPAPYGLWNPTGTPLLAQIQARDPVDAFTKAEDAYDLLRAILNFLHDTDKFQLQRPEPLAKVPPPAGYGVFLPDGSFEWSLVSGEHLALQGSTITHSSFQKAAEIAEKLSASGQPKGTLARFCEALRSYSHALDTTLWANSYLALWQALEILTFGPQRRYDMDNVVSRVVSLLQDQAARDFLSICAGRRDRLVHKGQFSPDGQSEVLLLKQVVRLCLLRFYELASIYASEEDMTQFLTDAARPGRNTAESPHV